jgi:hypothetical protein
MPSFQSRLPQFAPAEGALPTEERRPPLHPQELVLVGVTALHLSFLPWALGTMHVWSQLTSLGLAIVGIVLAALPRTGQQDDRNAPPPRQWLAARLLRLPAFWAGLLFLGYIVVQGLNPAWHFLSNEDSWWLEPVAHVSWLPSGVDAPFARANAWRALVIFGSLALLLCSVWTGFTRRRSFYALFALLTANAGALALFGLVQQMSGAKRIFWSYVSSNDSFVASFIYPNHAGPYFNLMVALAVGLAWWHHQRARKPRGNPVPAAAFISCATLSGALVIFSYSRMSIILLLATTLLVGGGLVIRLFRRTGPVRSRPEFLPLTLAAGAILGIGLVMLGTPKLRERFAGMIAHPAAAGLDRALARQAAGDMLRDHWPFGWGAGCFRYGFPKYTKNYPAIHYENGIRRTWEHAHDDLLEFPIEVGAVGLLPPAGIFCLGAWQLCRRRFWRNVVALSLVLGCTLAVLHAWVDFVFQNPAVLLTWGVLVAGALRWAELDQPGGRQESTGAL